MVSSLHLTVVLGNAHIVVKKNLYQMNPVSGADELNTSSDLSMDLQRWWKSRSSCLRKEYDTVNVKQTFVQRRRCRCSQPHITTDTRMANVKNSLLSNDTVLSAWLKIVPFSWVSAYDWHMVKWLWSLSDSTL